MRENGIYTEEMAKSIWDKAFFMDKIPGVRCVIDFGCADASMICMLGRLFPDIQFYGYEIDEDMVKRAEDNISQATSNVHCVFDNQNALISHISGQFAESEICLNFSSVLHEVFSFGEYHKAKLICDELKPKYITIRDMYFDGEDKDIPFATLRTMAKNIPSETINSFERCFGPISTMKGWTHFLMKYQWKDNGYEEELNEDYYSWDMALFQYHIGDKKYRTVFETHYQLPYLTEMWKSDYKFFYPEAHTHAQFILRRED